MKDIKYLGFDLSTQQLKAIVINEQLEICHQVSVSFELELGHEFDGCAGFVRCSVEPDKVTAPVYMWLKALDMCLEKLKANGLDFSSLACVSGCAQQHGSVWWRNGATEKLAQMDPRQSVADALGPGTFSLEHSPIWLDSSTSSECQLMETFIGSRARLTEITGCRAYERFAGPQIAKIIRYSPSIYEQTERITLISNFLASVLAGRFMPFEASDAAGTNMMDIRTKQWSRQCLEAILMCGSKDFPLDGLLERLGSTETQDQISDARDIIGTISPYFCRRYGFSPDCKLSGFMGDTVSSMAGLCVKRDEMVLSLGTSDTACFWMPEPVTSERGHISRCPQDAEHYVGMIGSKNGSKTRERVRDTFASGDWNEFAQLLDSTPSGNSGYLGFYFDLREIHPFCQGDFRFDPEDRQLINTDFPTRAHQVRACLEGQMMRLCNALKPVLERTNCLLVTGGASANKAILQVVANVFNRPVHALEMPNSACLGAAHLAAYANKLLMLSQRSSSLSSSSLSISCQETPTFEELITRRVRKRLEQDPNRVTVLPEPDSELIYGPLLKRQKKLELSLHEAGRSKLQVCDVVAKKEPMNHMSRMFSNQRFRQFEVANPS